MLRKGIHTLLLLLLCCTAYAQRYPFYNLNVENGLIQSQATSIIQDKFGHLWVGTLGGLSRYDGKSFTNFSVRNGMMNNTVSALGTDKLGNIWIGTSKGLSQFNGKTFKHYSFQTPESPSANSVSEIKIAQNGIVWCRAGGKIYSIAEGKSKPFELPDKEAKVSAILADETGLWAAKQGVIYHYSNNKWDSLAFNEPQLKGTPTTFDIYKDSRKRIWIGTNGGLYRIENNKLVIAHANNQSLYGLPPVLSITEDKHKNIWLGTTSGAYRLKDSSLVYCNKKNGLTDNALNQVITDTEGNIWMASDGQGVFRFSGAQFSVLDESSDLPSAQIMSIAAQGSRLYLGTYDAGLYVFEKGNIYKVPVPLKSTPAITAIRFRNSEIWLGTRGAGLLKYNGVSFKSYNAPTIPSNVITCIYTDPTNRMWIGFDNGIAYYQNDTFHNVKLTNTLIEDFISLGKDSMLIATNDGIKLFADDNISPYKTNSAADSATPQCFAIKGDELWIGTSDNGVICYNRVTGKSYVLNRNNGLQSDFIYNITTDNEDNIWVGTGYGIHKISTPKGKKPVVQFYGKGQGITGMESNHNAVFKMPDGGIWFGTTNGAVHYNPVSKIITPQPSSIVMQSVKLFGEDITDPAYFDSTDAWYNVPQKLHLPYKKNNLTFTFQALTLTGTEQLKYRYQIEGLDGQWSDWSAINTVTYSALPPGKYTLHVECMAGDSSSIRTLNYPFEIITPFQKTGWFRLLILAACILLGITIQYIVNRRKQNRIALMERLRTEEQTKVRERTAEDFHDEVGNKLTRINVLTNVLKNKLGTITPETKRILDQIQDNTGQLYTGTRDILWSLKPANDNLYEIIHRLRDFGGELFQDTEIDFSFSGTDEKWRNYRLPLDVSRNLMMIFKEALNNCLKYANADEVKLEAELEGDVMHIALTDNGKGFDLDTVQKGHGIDNMNIRATRIKGKLYMDTKPGKGTIISLRFKVVPGSV